MAHSMRSRQMRRRAVSRSSGSSILLPGCYLSCMVRKAASYESSPWHATRDWPSGENYLGCRPMRYASNFEAFDNVFTEYFTIAISDEDQSNLDTSATTSDGQHVSGRRACPGP